MTLSSKPIAYLFGGILVLILIAKALTVWTDYLWFGAMGQAPVFTTILGTRLMLGLVVGVLFFGWVYANMRHARRPLPQDVTLIGKRLLPDEERQQVEQYADRALLVAALILGLLAGLVTSGRWLPYLQMTHAVSFGQTEPIFGQDAGFYVFKLTFLRFLWSLCFYGAVVAIVASVLVHLYQEAIRIVGNTIQVLPRARAHVYCLLALALLVKIAGYRLDQFGLLMANRGGVFAGPAYADVYGRIPVLYGLMVLCAVGAAIILANVRSRRLFWPAGALVVVIVFSLLGGTTYPALVQKLVVLPTQLTKEKPFIQYNIEATTKAFGLDRVRNDVHRIGGDLTWQDIQRNRGTVDNIRLWDYRPLTKTLGQIQSLRAYYDFPDVDADRYMVDGRMRQVMIAARQIDANKIPPPQTWVKDRLQYTHGYGVAAVPVNEVQRGEGDEGLPNLWIRDIPPICKEGMAIDPARAGVYFQASSHPRLIELIQAVEARERAGEQPAPAGGGQGGAEEQGGPQPPGAKIQKIMDEPLARVESFVLANTKEPELDYPRLDTSGETNATTHYTGKGGVPVGGFLRRLAFFVRLHDLQILLTQSIIPESQIIIHRTLPERVQELCPMFLMCDPDPYIAVIGGRLVWINDAYTWSQMYPYSTRHTAVQVNYLRNSVKVVCDAYDGIPEFYVVDDTDPMLKCYQSIFPTLFKKEKAPEEVRKHFRYPELQFIVQAEMYADYHMTRAENFYEREDSWSIARELYGTEPRKMESYYVVMKVPGEQKEEFLLMVPMTVKGRDNMVAWMGARCDPEHYGELICYKMPKNMQVDGPMQVESLVGQNKDFSAKQTLWSQYGSTIIRGNLLVIPVEKSLLYVEPIYIAASNSAIPELKLVVLVQNKHVALGNDLEDALHKLFGGPEQAPAVAAPPQPAETPKAKTPGSLKELVDKAVQLEDDAKKALAAGDLGKYQQLHAEQAKLLLQIQAQLK